MTFRDDIQKKIDDKETLTVDDLLDSVDLKFDGYIPSAVAFEFFSFIRLALGEEPENANPLAHYFLIDTIFKQDNVDRYYDRRGIDYHALKGKTAILCCREFSKALALDTKIITPNGHTTMGDIKVGDTVYDRNGMPTLVRSKSKLFLKHTYRMVLEDGRELYMSEDHDNIIWKRKNKRLHGKNQKYHIQGMEETVMTARQIHEEGIFWRRTVTEKMKSGKQHKFYIPRMQNPVDMPETDFPLDAYTVGLILGDGNISKDTGFTRITAHIDDYVDIVKHIPYEIGTVNESRENIKFFSIKGIGQLVKEHVGTWNVYEKRVPDKLKVGSIQQRLGVLQGLMDTDGTVNTKGSTSFSSVSYQLASDVQELVWSLGGSATIKEYKSESPFGKYWMVNIRLNMDLFKLQRKVNRQKYVAARDKVAIIDMELVHTRPAQCITVESDTKSFLAENYVVTHNSTLIGTFLPLFMAWKGEIPGYGKVNYGLYVGDSMRNNVKTTMNTIEKVFLESEWLLDQFESYRFTDEVMELVRHPRTKKEIAEYERAMGMGKKKEQVPGRSKRQFSMKGVGAQALPLDAVLYTENGKTTMEKVQVGDMIYGADGKLAKVTKKSEIFYRPMYRIKLEDGRSIDVSDDHINSIVNKTIPSRKTGFKTSYEKMDVTTTELLDMKMFHTRVRKGIEQKERLLFIENCHSLQYKDRIVRVDPYTLGVFLGDGTIKKNKQSVRITCHEDDLPTYQKHIPYELGEIQSDIRNGHIKTFTVLGIGSRIAELGLQVNSYDKFIPEEYFYGSENQRLSLLQGLIDTDGTVNKDRGKARFISTSEQLARDVANLVRSLGGRASVVSKNKYESISYIHGREVQSKRVTYITYIWLNMPIARLERKLSLQTYDTTVYGKYVAITAIEPIDAVPSQCIAIDNEEHQYITGEYIRTHNTGTRGTRSGLQRPQFAIFDDLVPSEADANSDAILESIETTIDSDVLKALHGGGSFAMIIGTPYNKKDPVYSRIESGSWVPVVFPICKEIRHDMTEEEFEGVWEDRHSYKNVMKRYRDDVKDGKTKAFMQELMLRINTGESRLIDEHDIVWYERATVLQNKGRYNFYITTDFATSEKKSADYSVISVWAYNNNGDWLWIDGVCKKQNMNDNITELFKYVSIYKPESVGVEVTGQQGGFIDWIQQQMIEKNIFFTLAQEEGKSKPGFRPSTGKLERFNTVVPLFKNKKIWFPKGMDKHPAIMEAKEELMNVGRGGFKSKHDDFADTVSMLSLMRPWKPSGDVQYKEKSDGVWEEIPDFEEDSMQNSLIF